MIGFLPPTMSVYQFDVERVYSEFTCILYIYIYLYILICLFVFMRTDSFCSFTVHLHFGNLLELLWSNSLGRICSMRMPWPSELPEVLWPSWPCSSLWMARPWRREALRTAQCNKAPGNKLRFSTCASMRTHIITDFVSCPRVRSLGFWDKPGLPNADICKHVKLSAQHAL